MRLRQHLFPGAIVTSTLGLSALLVAGCDSSPGNEYRSVSSDEADRIDEARAARGPDDSLRTGDPPPAAEQSSPLLLAAAQTAARIARAPAANGPLSADLSVARTVASSAQRPSPPPAAGVPDAVPPAAGAGDLTKRAAERAASVVGTEAPVRSIKLLVPQRSFSVEGPGDALRISYDDFDLLKVLNMDPVPPDATEHFPDWLAGLDGKRVRVRGFMYPTFQETGIPAFVLARDNQICCFGRNPKIYDLVEVTLAGGITTDYIQGRPFDVVGNFHIRPEADGDELWQLYQIDDAIVIDD